MWKMWFQVLFVSACAVALVACGNSKSSKSNTSTQCFYNPYTGGCDNTAYNNYNNYGYSAYPGNPWNSNYQNFMGSLCGCGPGSRPVYNGNMGMGCANQNAFPNYAPIYYWSWSANNPMNSHHVNIPQVSNINYANQTGCYNDTAWSCMVNQPNQCPTGTTCRASNPNSPMGVCITL